MEISEKADNLITRYGITKSRWSEDGWDHWQNLRAYIAELEAKNTRLKEELTEAIEIGNEMAIGVRNHSYRRAEFASDRWIMFTLNTQEAKND